jgi:hypothetical protein
MTTYRPLAIILPGEEDLLFDAAYVEGGDSALSDDTDDTYVRFAPGGEDTRNRAFIHMGYLEAGAGLLRIRGSASAHDCPMSSITVTNGTDTVELDPLIMDIDIDPADTWRQWALTFPDGDITVDVIGGGTGLENYMFFYEMEAVFDVPVPAPPARLSGRGDGRGPLGGPRRLDTEPVSGYGRTSVHPGAPGSYY